MPAPPRDGEVLDGKYRIQQKLGEGGMGAVYAGENLRVKRAVAIKILHSAASAVAEMAGRFEREAQAAGQIGNDHIVEVYDLGVTAAGERYMVMEYLQGESLRTRQKRLRKLGVEETAWLFCQLLEGLDAAHRAGIVHRDLKPDNVFILSEKAGMRDFVKVLDFGISKFTQGGEGSMTRTGTLMGSPNYMSPEHVRSSNEVEPRSDIYAAGVMLYECVTGQLPRKAPAFAELLFRIAYEPMPDPRQLDPTLPEAFVAVILKACATKMEERFQSCAEMAAALAPFAARAVPPAQGSGRGAHPGDPEGPSTIALSSSDIVSAPSFRFTPVSQPSFGSASHPRAVPPPTPSAPGGPPALTGGTQLIPGAYGSASQPSFNGAPYPGASQPSFAGASQPSYGAFPNGADASGHGSQPSYGGASQPGLPVGTAAPLTISAPTAQPARSNKGPVLAVAAFAALGVVGGVGYFALSSPPAAPAAASAATAVPSSPAATGAQTAAATATATVEASATAAPSSSAAPSASASAKPKVGPKGPRRPDPGY